MSNGSHHNDPAITHEQAPEHGPTFWGDLEASLTSETAVIAAVADSAQAPAAGHTEQMPKVAVMAEHVPVAAAQPSRRFWPVAAAAAVLAVLGLGIIAFQGNDPGNTAEIVAGPNDTDSQVVPLDGPTDEDGANDDSASADTDSSSDGVETVPTPEAAGADAATAEPMATPAPVREFDSAFGATGTAAFPPFDDSLSPTAVFLANWDSRALTWYSEVDADVSCVDQNVAEISYVNGSGLVQDVRDPQLRFSGEISHFTVHPEENLAGWLVSCGNQLELYTATLADSGQVEHLNLVWLGDGSPRAALMLWDENEISLNAIDPSGTPFAISYDLDVDVLTRDGDPSLDAREAGSPVWRDATPIAATVDGGVSYWVGQAPADIFSACPETFGSDETETLWLRYGDGTWQPALVDETPLGTVTAAAVEPTISQIAFADVCDGQTQRLFLGTQRADGRISNLREVSLTPYVPGFASELFWVDAQTLRIEIDNSAFGAPPNRLDFRFDDGRQEGIIVQLD